MRKFEITNQVTVSDLNIEDLLVTAFEGGINYWCGKIEIGKPPITNTGYLSDVINNGGTLMLIDADDDTNKPDIWELTEENLIKGIAQYMRENNYASVDDLIDDHDADVADCIVQYALFGELVFC
jgi:hypothetical protein